MSSNFKHSLGLVTATLFKLAASQTTGDVPGILLTGSSGVPRFAHDILARDDLLPSLQPRQYCYANQGLGTCPGGHCCYLSDYCTIAGCCPRATGTTCGHGRGCWDKNVVCCGYSACNPGDKCNSGVGCCKPEWTMCDRYCCEAGYGCSVYWGYCTRLGGGGGGGGGGGTPPGDETNPNPDKPDLPPPPPADDGGDTGGEDPDEPTQNPPPDAEPTNPPTQPPPPPAEETSTTTAVIQPPPEVPEPDIEDSFEQTTTTTSESLPSFTQPTINNATQDNFDGIGGGNFSAGSLTVLDLTMWTKMILGIWVIRIIL